MSQRCRRMALWTRLGKTIEQGFGGEIAVVKACQDALLFSSARNTQLNEIRAVLLPKTVSFIAIG